MAFLKINGVTIPVAFQSASGSPEQIGKFGRAVSGAGLRGSRGTKSMRSFTTAPLTSVDATALIEMIGGQGQHFSFDTDSYATGGLADSAEQGVTFDNADTNIMSNTAADGDAVRVWNDTDGASYPQAARVGCVSSDIGSTNVLSSDQADCEGTGAFSAISAATVTEQHADDYFQDTYSVKCATTAGAIRGLLHTALITGISSGAAYTARVAVKGDSGGEDLNFVINEYTAADALITQTSVSFTCTADAWTHVFNTITTDATTAKIRLQVSDGASGDANTFYIDALQLEALAFPTAWQDGGVTRASPGQIKYPASILNAAENFTIAFWANNSASASSGTTDGYAIDIVETGTSNRVAFYFDDSTVRRPTVAWIDDAGASTGTNGTATSLNTWHHYALTYDATTGTGSLYQDGALANSTTVAAGLDLTSIAGIAVGNAYLSTGVPLNGQVDDLLIIPAAMSATQVAGLYNSGTAPSIGMPRVIATGDFTRCTEVECYGEITGVAYVGLDRGTGNGWENNAQAITFRLMEV